MGKILIFKMKNFCYASSFYFADRVAECFDNLGWDVEIFDLLRDGKGQLQKYCGQKFDAILDFNSQLPKLLTDDGEIFLNTIEGPFYNYILDHPLYHHEMLTQKVKNYHVICVDDNHRRYIERWYPNIQSAHVLPVAGSTADVILPMEQRPIDVLFTGTYTNPEDMYRLMLKMGGNRSDELQAMLERQMANQNLPLETVFEKFLSEIGRSAEEVDFPLRMWSYFPIDTYATASFRERVVKTIAEGGIRINIAGHGWDKCKELSGLSNVTFMGPVDFHRQFELMAQAKIVLNVMPGFKAGIHDRVFSAMCNGAVCLSDSSEMLAEEFEDGTDLITFSGDSLYELPELIKKWTGDVEGLNNIAIHGRNKCEKNHTWMAHCSLMKKIFEKN